MQKNKITSCTLISDLIAGWGVWTGLDVSQNYCANPLPGAHECSLNINMLKVCTCMLLAFPGRQLLLPVATCLGKGSGTNASRACLISRCWNTIFFSQR
jgi:hypothetical protein